jgi:drug/metabolite transporter (DMT)-like permease
VSPRARAYVVLVVVVSIWASYPALGKLALRDFPPFLVAAVRCSLASVFLVALLLSAGAPLHGITPSAFRAFLFLGISGYWVSTQFSYLGYYFTTAANAVILQAATPVMVALGARCYLGERLTRLQQVGAGVSVLGVLFVITNGRLALLRPGEIRPGDLITLGALTGWAAYTVYGKRVMREHSADLATTAAYVLGTLLMIPTAAATAPYFPPPRLSSGTAWAIIVFQAIVGGLAHVWWYRAVNVVGASVSAIFINVQPLVGVVLAFLILGETIGVWQVVGGTLVVAGVVLTGSGGQRSTPEPRTATSAS